MRLVARKSDPCVTLPLGIKASEHQHWRHLATTGQDYLFLPLVAEKYLAILYFTSIVLHLEGMVTFYEQPNSESM